MKITRRRITTLAVHQSPVFPFGSSCEPKLLPTWGHPRWHRNLWVLRWGPHRNQVSVHASRRTPTPYHRPTFLSETKWEGRAASMPYITMSTSTKYRVNLLCVRRSTVTLCAGLLVACILNASFQSQHIMKPALDIFLWPFCYRDCSLVRLTNPDKGKGVQNSNKSYCWCGGEDIGKMITYDNASCAREWFHFQCVGLTRKKQPSIMLDNTINSNSKPRNKYDINWLKQ